MNYKERKCKISGFVWKQYNSLQKCPCNDCVKEREENKKPPVFKPKTPIKKVSDKRKIKDLQYYALRKVFLEKPENKICPITGWPTTEVHHKYSGKDRDKHYLDTETWLAVSRDGHNWIHDNPQEAREKGYLY